MNSIARLLWETPTCFRSTDRLLSAALTGLLAETGAQSAAVNVDTAFFGHSVSSTHQADLKSAAPGRSSTHLVVPLLHAGRCLGSMRLTFAGSEPTSGPFFDKLMAIARWLARRLHGVVVLQRLEKLFPASVPLLGPSPVVEEAERSLEEAAQVELPVHLQGEPGTESDYAALSIHLASGRRDGPFVTIECGAGAGEGPAPAQIAALLSMAAGGTVFLRHLDELPARLQPPVLGLLATCTPYPQQQRSPVATVRLLASTDETPGSRGGEESSPLAAIRCGVAVRLPALRERRDDVAPLLRYLVERSPPHRPRPVSQELTSLLREHSWNGNAEEAAQVATCLLGSNDTVLTLASLRGHMPGVFARPKPEPEGGAANPGAGRNADLRGGARLLAEKLLNGSFTPPDDLHPGVRKALQYLVSHFHGPVRLDAMARHSCLAAAHLSFLFHKSVGCTVRDLLCALRIEKARHLIAAQPYRKVTEICFEVGFGELSTFERSFKRMVGCKPREYKGFFDASQRAGKPGAAGTRREPRNKNSPSDS